MSPSRTCLPVALALLGATAAGASPDEGPVAASNLEVRVENLPAADGKVGAFFSARGRTQPLIDGTQLEVTLLAIGRSKDFPVKITRAVVKNQQYEVSFPWPDRVFAPLVYEVKVELVLGKQPKSVRNWIMTEYGYAPTHRETLDRRRAPVGTREERVAFAIQNIEHIKDFVLKLDEHRVQVGELAAAAAPEGEQAQQQQAQMDLTEGLIGYRRDVDAYFRQYVILLEQGFYKRILGHLRTLDRILRDCGRGAADLDARLAELHRELGASVELIKQYAPVPAEETLIPDRDVQPREGDDGASDDDDPEQPGAGEGED